MKKANFLILGFVLISMGAAAQFNFFTIDDDIKLGQQLRDEIAKNPKEYPVLDEKQYPQAYAHLRRITNAILNSGSIRYKDKFAWELKIIHNDKTLNAFVAPGGYIYVYTGLIKFLDTEDQLAGVMGHEIAHADRRHSTQNMTKQYGVATILGMLAGRRSQNMLTQMVGGLIGLKFSRGSEKEADDFSVEYLSKTSYACNGTAGFFEKIVNSGNKNEPPQFLSTHPSSPTRVKDINTKANALGCSTNPSGNDYQALKNSLPK